MTSSPRPTMAPRPLTSGSCRPPSFSPGSPTWLAASSSASHSFAPTSSPDGLPYSSLLAPWQPSQRAWCRSTKGCSLSRPAWPSSASAIPCGASSVRQPLRPSSTLSVCSSTRSVPSDRPRHSTPHPTESVGRMGAIRARRPDRGPGHSRFYAPFRTGWWSPVAAANPRITASPVPVVVHIVCAVVYAILGAFQFSAALRRRRPGWHRVAGRVVVVLGLAVALSALWMTQFYPRAPGGELAYAFRLAFGSGMAASIILGFDAIRRGDVARHRAWMARAYALALGAGTQAFTQGVGNAVFGISELNTALGLGAGW